MATGIFKGPKGALIFMGATIVSVMMLVGTEDSEGALVMATDELSRDDGARDVRSLPPPAPARPIRRPQPRIEDSTVFASDEELIDDTSGFDPTPDTAASFDTGPGSGEVVAFESYGEPEVR